MRLYTPFINVSGIISAYCYSLFRAEPYADCEHGCLYCYARWRRRGSGPIYGAPRQFAAIASRIRKRDLRPIPVRLSTLTDPFQPSEYRYRLSLRILRWALGLGYPIIVNTKGVMMAEGRWLEALRGRDIGFATCKEGLYGLHTAEDCCGLYLLGDYAKRLTLYEFYREALKRPLRLDAQ